MSEKHKPTCASRCARMRLPMPFAVLPTEMPPICEGGHTSHNCNCGAEAEPPPAWKHYPRCAKARTPTRACNLPSMCAEMNAPEPVAAVCTREGEPWPRHEFRGDSCVYCGARCDCGFPHFSEEPVAADTPEGGGALDAILGLLRSMPEVVPVDGAAFTVDELSTVAADAADGIDDGEPLYQETINLIFPGDETTEASPPPVSPEAAKLREALRRALFDGQGGCRWCGAIAPAMIPHFEDCPSHALLASPAASAGEAPKHRCSRQHACIGCPDCKPEAPKHPGACTCDACMLAAMAESCAPEEPKRADGPERVTLGTRDGGIALSPSERYAPVDYVRADVAERMAQNMRIAHRSEVSRLETKLVAANASNEAYRSGTVRYGEVVQRLEAELSEATGQRDTNGKLLEVALKELDLYLLDLYRRELEEAKTTSSRLRRTYEAAVSEARQARGELEASLGEVERLRTDLKASETARSSQVSARDLTIAGLRTRWVAIADYLMHAAPDGVYERVKRLLEGK